MSSQVAKFILIWAVKPICVVRDETVVFSLSQKVSLVIGKYRAARNNLPAEMRRSRDHRGGFLLTQLPKKELGTFHVNFYSILNRDLQILRSAQVSKVNITVL